ncbi:tripartite tricarboxylate transporter substrate binding protein [Ramlibacter sp. AW1]|uniref:Tripartite tricarboxylate transporter substrate binding protein n=1 Tax=Ramlibacter aurantiacus TaxID=2801330 RepID=A0A936ZH28_9BURK|nr:tripartite tricarboxylate transporter substrate binding protein [Ramlibacter aurantiacus]MBL0420792.1 tripartite tricarboxylate transporter substrate binding protein [Ramlibacter aurantiacus]
MKKRSLLAFALITATGLGSLSAPAHAQGNWPARPVKLIVPYPAGGPVDQLARTIAPRLGEVLGQSIVIENKSGASGVIGMDAAIKAEPDGYTFGFGVPGGITVLPHLQKMPYAVDEINYVSLVARIPQVITVGPQVPVSTLPELVAMAKAQPGKINYGSAGNVTTPHLGAELLAQETGIKMQHVPYKGAAPAVTGLLGGEIQVLAADLPAVIGFSSRGVKILAVASPRRSEALPDVPTTAEVGLPGVVNESSYGLIAQKATPPAITQKMREALITTLNTPAVKEQLAKQGAVATSTTPDEYRKLMQSESAKWGALVKKANITLN